MNRNKSFVLIALAILLIAVGSIGILPIDLNVPVEAHENTIGPKTAGFWDLTGTPIVIDNNWSDTRVMYDWCTGLGTVDQPYVIENVTIDGMQNGSCITIKNTNEYFEIRNCTLLNVTTVSQVAIYIRNVTYGKILNCHFFKNAEFCIDLYNCTQFVISNNSFKNYKRGIFTHDSYRIDINYNNFTGGSAMWINESFNSTIVNNRIINASNGIRLVGYPTSLNHSNYIANNILGNIKDHGIDIERSHNNTIINNILYNISLNGFYYGITIDKSNYSQIINNSITNSYRGINLGGPYNLAYLNYIETIDVNAYNSHITNRWDNGSIGNYYSDYLGKDTNDDGIGDTPYNITENIEAVDNYPIWWDAPAISIISPNTSDTFEHIPSFEISIDEGIEDAKWYTIDDGATNFTITSLTGTINDSAWEAASNGLIRMVVYANDSRGYIGSAEVQFTRSVNPPDIEFTIPTLNQEFRVNPPSFTVTIDDLSPIVGRWYTIDGGANYYNFTGLTGTVDNDAWNSTSEGIVTLIVYAVDDLGNIGSKSITIMKNISSGPEPEPDPEPTPSSERAISGYNTYIIFGIVITISVIFIKKKRAR